MLQASFRFYGNLNDFLPELQRQKSVFFPLNGPVAVKHPVEALGVPHTEVEHLLANRMSVGFSYLVQPGDQISVYPPFYEIDLKSPYPLRPPLPTPPRFILDNHLGQLATYLRLLGFDAQYHNHYQDEELARVSHEEERVLLTRDRRLLMRKIVIYGYWLRAKDPRQQLTEILSRYKLANHIHPWHRCLRCNGLLRPVPKEAILDRLEPKTKKYYHEFHICQDCEQIYWKGSHWTRMHNMLSVLCAGPTNTRHGA